MVVLFPCHLTCEGFLCTILSTFQGFSPYNPIKDIHAHYLAQAIQIEAGHLHVKQPRSKK